MHFCQFNKNVFKALKRIQEGKTKSNFQKFTKLILIIFQLSERKLGTIINIYNNIFKLEYFFILLFYLLFSYISFGL